MNYILTSDEMRKFNIYQRLAERSYNLYYSNGADMPLQNGEATLGDDFRSWETAVLEYEIVIGKKSQ